MSPDTISQSPTPPSATPQGGMSFVLAISEVIRGKKITKKEWANPDSYCMLRDKLLMIHRDGKWHKWIINDGDLLGEDWIVIE